MVHISIELTSNCVYPKKTLRSSPCVRLESVTKVMIKALVGDPGSTQRVNKIFGACERTFRNLLLGGGWGGGLLLPRSNRQWPRYVGTSVDRQV